MPDARIRRAAAADLPVLTRLWQTAFGDPPELIGAFYHRFPPQAAAWVVEVNGAVVTAAHLLGGRLHTADGTALPCAYVYAVSTDPAQQGHGYASALMRRFAAEADANGCVLYTLPAEASLYAWYRSVMGTTQTARGARLRIARAPDMQCPPVIERVSAQEYAALREQALRGRAHVELSAAAAGISGRSLRSVRRRAGAHRQRVCRCGAGRGAAAHKGAAGYGRFAGRSGTACRLRRTGGAAVCSAARRRTGAGCLPPAFLCGFGCALGTLSGLSESFIN